jgi:hypothetical protein
VEIISGLQHLCQIMKQCLHFLVRGLEHGDRIDLEDIY